MAFVGSGCVIIANGRLNVRQLFGRLEIRKNFYTVRTAKAWNDIPTEIKELKRHGQFKKSYAKWKDAHLHRSKSKCLIVLVHQAVAEQQYASARTTAVPTFFPVVPRALKNIPPILK